VAGVPASEVGTSGQKSPAYEVDHKIET
ncbi:uncharacterized protein METZ01_LOCUS489330, partial [marine metagenome]